MKFENCTKLLQFAWHSAPRLYTIPRARTSQDSPAIPGRVRRGGWKRIDRLCSWESASRGRAFNDYATTLQPPARICVANPEGSDGEHALPPKVTALRDRDACVPTLRAFVRFFFSPFCVCMLGGGCN